MSPGAAHMRLFSLAVHELRTPAGVIGGCLRILRVTRDGDPRREQVLAQADRNYDRLVDILAEMSDLWRLEAGEAVFNRQPFDLGPVLQNVCKRTAPRLPAGAELRVDAEAFSGVRVTSDPVRLERAFTTLALAVARHISSDDRPVIEITRAPAAAPSMVRVLVAGAVSAIPGPEPALTDVDEFESGLGLALPIAMRVIESDGGTVHMVEGGPRAFAADLKLSA